MATYSLLPFVKPHFHSNDGGPAVGYKLYSFDSSTSLPAPLFANHDGTGSYGAYVELNSRGEPDGEGLYGTDGKTYKLIFRTPEGGDIWTMLDVECVAPGGGGGTTVTMDTIVQGTSYQKMTASSVNSLTQGASTTLHYHSADRAWSTLTGKPSTFTPSTHATSHKTGGSDILVHNDLAPAKAASGVAYGHIDDGSQTIAGDKRLSGAITQFGDQALRDVSSIDIDGINGSFHAQGGIYPDVYIESGRGVDSSLTVMQGQEQLSRVLVQQIRNGIVSYVETVATYENAYISLQSAGALLMRFGIDSGIPNILLNESTWTSDEPLGAYVFASKYWATSQFGGAAIAYNHTQSVAALTWTINHGKTAYYPVIQCVDSSGSVVNGSIQHYSGYTTVIFAFATSGKARAV